MNPDRSAAVARLAELTVAIERSHPVRVAVDGFDGAGTTTLSDELARSIRTRGRPCLRASLDSFRRPADERHRARSREPSDHRESFDFGAIRSALLQPLGRGGDRRYRTALHDEDADVVVRQAPPDAVLVVDGCFLQGPELDGCWEFRVWVDVSTEIARARAVTRDRGSFGPEVDRRYRDVTMPAQRRYLEETDPPRLADVQFVNNDPDHPILVFPR